jgi:putative ABC transport system substrate-binding protein
MNYQSEIAALAMQHRLPTMCTRSDYTQHGCLISYGTNRPALYGRAATYVGKILRETKPCDLPIEAPSAFELVVNARTQQALGVAIPPNVAVQVTQWVD